MKYSHPIQPPFIPRNPLADLQRMIEKQAELHVELVGWARETSAAVAALRACMHALVLTHHDPKALAEAYQEQMDKLADSVAPERVEIYRSEAQSFHNTILSALNHPQTKA